MEEASLKISKLYRLYQDADQLTANESVTLPQGESEVEINIGSISDAVISLSLTDGFADEVYVSGGAFANNMGSGSSFSQFKISASEGFAADTIPSINLAGKFTASGSLKDWVSVIRSLNANASAVDLSEYETIKFRARGAGTLDLALDTEGSKDYNYFTYSVQLKSSEQEYEINLDDFKKRFGGSGELDKSKISLVIFMMDKSKNTSLSSFNFEVGSIAFADNTPGNGGAERPKKFELKQNYPNPFNPATVIQVDILNKDFYSLKVYDIMGREVATLLEGELKPDTYKVTFNGSGLASGVYFYRILGQKINITKKMLLIR
ncbi:MAG TPA: CIA30 family protein [Ignavibacteriales bacterium]|nr:CIA30 family protein [Ignavibacteriales bacterium]